VIAVPGLVEFVQGCDGFGARVLVPVFGGGGDVNAVVSAHVRLLPCRER
jgi:hypothetical protein